MWWWVGGGGGMRPNTATSRSFAFAFASTTLSINPVAWNCYHTHPVLSTINIRHQDLVAKSDLLTPDIYIAVLWWSLLLPAGCNLKLHLTASLIVCVADQRSLNLLHCLTWIFDTDLDHLDQHVSVLTLTIQPEYLHQNQYFSTNWSYWPDIIKITYIKFGHIKGQFYSGRIQKGLSDLVN